MKKLLLLTTMASCAISFAPNASAESSSSSFWEDNKIEGGFWHKDRWMLRLRHLTVNPNESSNVTNGDQAEINSQTIPELDITYFFTKNIAAELILGTARHDAGTNTGTDLGHFKILPPTLTAQYHFAPEETIRPYIGAGINYTMFYDIKEANGINDVQYEDNFGFALQTGFDYMFDDNWGINFDVKKIFLNTEANINNGAIIADIDVDPWLWGVGVTYKF